VGESDDSEEELDTHYQAEVPVPSQDYEPGHREQTVAWAMEMAYLELECQRKIALSKSEEGSKKRSSDNKSSFQAVLAEDEKRSVIVKKVVDSLKCEQMTNDYIIGRLKSLAGALGRYPQTNTDATDDFFKVATGSEEDRSFSQPLGRKDENS
jgi:hypothetical protein